MRAYLTGGTGFVGAWLQRHLAEAGDSIVGPGARGRRHRPRGFARAGSSRRLARGRLPPRGPHPRRPLLGRARRDLPRERPRHLEPARGCQALRGAPRRRARQLGRGLRPGERRQALRRAVRAPARQPVRRQQGGGRVPRPAGLLGPRASRGAGEAVQPRRARPGGRLRGVGSRQTHGRGRAGQDRHGPGRQSRRVAGLHRRARRRAGLPAAGDERRSRARPTTSARAGRSASPRWPRRCWRCSPTTSSSSRTRPCSVPSTSRCC